MVLNNWNKNLKVTHGCPWEVSRPHHLASVVDGGFDDLQSVPENVGQGKKLEQSIDKEEDLDEHVEAVETGALEASAASEDLLEADSSTFSEIFS